MELWGGHAPRFLCYQLVFLLDFFTAERSYQGLKDATLFGLISDKSAEIQGPEYWKNCQFSIQNRPFLPFFFVFACMQMRLLHHFRSEKNLCGMENFQYFEYLDLNYSALLAD